MKELFKMSDLGLLSYYLGIEVHQKLGEITLCQEAYAKKYSRVVLWKIAIQLKFLWNLGLSLAREASTRG
jgi:hypothetical protein